MRHRAELFKVALNKPHWLLSFGTGFWFQSTRHVSPWHSTGSIDFRQTFANCGPQPPLEVNEVTAATHGGRISPSLEVRSTLPEEEKNEDSQRSSLRDRKSTRLNSSH